MSGNTTLKKLTKREKNRTEKRKRALDAALVVFSRNGYAASTMDAIASEAGLTKPTLYQYFPSKDELFKEMMLAPRQQILMAFEHSKNDCHVSQMLEFSWAYATTVMRPEFLALARLVIADAHRHPELGQHYQAVGPDRVLKGLAEFMNAQASRGRLDIEDAELAAEDFWGLILSAPRNRALHVPDTRFSRDQLARYINNGITVFLKAYSTNRADDLLQLTQLTQKRLRKKDYAE